MSCPADCQTEDDHVSSCASCEYDHTGSLFQELSHASKFEFPEPQALRFATGTILVVCLEYLWLLAVRLRVSLGYIIWSVILFTFSFDKWF